MPLVLTQSHSIEVYRTNYERNIVQPVIFRWHILRVCRTLYYHELGRVNWTGIGLPISNTVRLLCAIHKKILKMLQICEDSCSLRILRDGCAATTKGRRPSHLQGEALSCCCRDPWHAFCKTRESSMRGCQWVIAPSFMRSQQGSVHVLGHMCSLLHLGI